MHAGGDGGFAGRLLASRPAVAIGLLSYGWYLWHWPLLAMDAAARLEPASPLHRVLLCLVALAAAAASLRWVERPVRALRWAPRQWLLGAAVAVTAFVGAWYWTAGLERMPPGVAEMARRARDDVPEHMKRCHFTLRSDVRALMPPRCDSAPGQPPRLAVWGDSHAEAWQPAAWEIARARGVAATAMTMGWQPCRRSWRPGSPDWP